MKGLEFCWVKLKRKLKLKFDGMGKGELTKLLSETLVQRWYFDASS